MPRNAMMSSFPPPAEQQVTLANWMTKPFNEWAFRNIRRILPTADVRRSSSVERLPLDLKNIGEVSFKGIDGETTNVGACKGLEVDGLIVLHRGRIAWEYYDHGFAPEMQHIVFSVTKSFTGTLTGILADAGKLDPEDAVTKYIPEAEGTAYGTAKIRHLLDMSVGISFDENYTDKQGVMARYRRAAGWSVNETGGLPSPHLREFLVTLEASGEPHGHKFHYVSPNTDMLGWVLERAAGLPFPQLVHEYIWAPLGAEEDAYVGLDPYGASRPAGGFCATIRDLARFGEMMRNNGVSATGRRVVPTWWIDDIQNNGDAQAWERGEFTKLFPRGNYRNKWYTPDRSRRAFCGIGIHGQYLYVDPEDEMVIVRVSSQSVAFDAAYDLAWMRACRAIGDRLNGRVVG